MTTMWRYLSGAKKPEPVKHNPLPLAKAESNKKYEQKRTRSFLPKWQIARPWLVDTENGMTCLWCIEFKETLVSQNCLQSMKFIDGCKSYKSESIAHHEASSAHSLASRCFRSKEKPEAAPANRALVQLNKQHSAKLGLLFRNAHALAKNRKSMRDYNWLCKLDEAKGLVLGKTYRNQTACRTFTKYISKDSLQQCATEFSGAKFVTVTSDGSTNSSITEQEIVFVRYSYKGTPITKFAGVKAPLSPDASGLFQSILDVLADIDLNKDDLKRKLVAFGCDGASVMVGRVGGVATKFKDIQPSMIVVHCLAHRLELAYKDVIKANKLYDSALVLLMGLYYLYHNSPKQRLNLRRSFETLKQVPVMPTRVGGTRWVGHMLLALTNFFKGYKAIRAQIEDCISQVTKGEAQNKARGYIRLLKRPDVIGFIHLLSDILKPLHSLSRALQSNETTLAEVDDHINVCKDLLTTYSHSNGPKLSKFLNDYEPSKFCDEVMSGDPDQTQLEKHRTTLAKGLLKSFAKRFSDVSENLISATRISNFKQWPFHDKKDDIKEFGVEEIQVICNHYASVLESSGVQLDEVPSEWMLLKSLLYSRFKAKVQELVWSEVYDSCLEEHGNILTIIDLIVTLPACSAENERGFSNLKLIKTANRSKMSSNTLTELLRIQMCSPDVSNFDPDSSIKMRLQGSKRSRRVAFRDNGDPKPKKARLTIHEPVQDVEPVDVVQPAPEDQPLEEADMMMDVVFDPSADHDDLDDEGFMEMSDDENELSEQDILKMLDKV